MASPKFHRSKSTMPHIRRGVSLVFLVAALLSFVNVSLTGVDRVSEAVDLPLIVSSPVLELSWDASQLATKFRIEINTRSDWGQEGRFALFEDFGTATYVRVGPFPPGETVYYWRVWAGNDAGWSPPANGDPFVVLRESDSGGTDEDPNDGVTPGNPGNGSDQVGIGEPLPMPQNGLWSDPHRVIKVFVQKHLTGSCLIIASTDGTDMVAFLDENYRNGIDVPNDVDGQNYAVRLLLTDSFNGSLSITLPSGSMTTAVSCIFDEVD